MNIETRQNFLKLKEVFGYISIVASFITIFLITILVLNNDIGETYNSLVKYATFSGYITLFFITLLVALSTILVQSGKKLVSTIVQTSVVLILIIMAFVWYNKLLNQSNNYNEYSYYSSVSYISLNSAFLAFWMLVYYVVNQFAARYINISALYTAIVCTLLLASSTLLVALTLLLLDISNYNYDISSKFLILGFIYSAATLVGLPLLHLMQRGSFLPKALEVKK